MFVTEPKLPEMSRRVLSLVLLLQENLQLLAELPQVLQTKVNNILNLFMLRHTISCSKCSSTKFNLCMVTYCDLAGN